MMPMTATSTGAPLRPSASPAARPSSTISTFSCTPAPTESTASSGVPRGVSSSEIGCTSSSFAPSNVRCFCVETTVPMTRAICIYEFTNLRIVGFGLAMETLQFVNSSIRRFVNNIIVINDADDAGIGRNLDGIEGEARFLAAHEEHGLSHPCSDRIDRHERPSHVRAVSRNRLQDHQLDTRQVVVFPRDDDV